MKKPMYLGKVNLDLSKIVMYEFCYIYMKPKCNFVTQTLIHLFTTLTKMKDISNDFMLTFNKHGYSDKDDQSLPIGFNKKIIGLMKDKLNEKCMSEFVALRPKSYAQKKTDGKEDKKYKGTKKCVVKKTLRYLDLQKAFDTVECEILIKK